MRRRFTFACMLLSITATAAAQHVGRDQAVIADAARDAHGRLAVNQAAGAGNAQANLAALAIAPTAPVSLHLQQRAQITDPHRDASASISGASFAAGSGLVSVNQVAGSGNTQANLFASGHVGPIAGLITGVDDAALAAVAGDSGTEGAAATHALREAVIENGAFAGSQGVVQVNQTAGVGNASVNAIVLQLPGGTR